MDLRHTYAEIARIEGDIEDREAVVVSLATGDGGKAGVCTEVPRGVAARLIAEKRARLATGEEAQQFRDENAAAQRQAREKQMAQRIQLAVLTEADLAMLRQALRPEQQ